MRRRWSVLTLVLPLILPALFSAMPRPAPSRPASFDGDCWTRKQACKVCGKTPGIDNAVEAHEACIALYESMKSDPREKDSTPVTVYFAVEPPDFARAPKEKEITPAEPVPDFALNTPPPFKIPIETAPVSM